MNSWKQIDWPWLLSGQQVWCSSVQSASSHALRKVLIWSLLPNCRLAAWVLDICLLSPPLLHRAPLHCLHLALHFLHAISLSSPCTALHARHFTVFTLHCTPWAPLHCLHLALHFLRATSLSSPCTALPAHHFTLLFTSGFSRTTAPLLRTRRLDAKCKFPIRLNSAVQLTTTANLRT
jgi:hypothetical protein